MVGERPAANVVRGPAHPLCGATTLFPVLDVEDLAVTGTSGQPDRLSATLTHSPIISPPTTQNSPLLRDVAAGLH
ncbi:hypothetical protein EV652_10674 [Kribbella steppae]|uniref:Uncharacterized protein n=1 Tax=Kribbella steppae TaxID=2512223 RepID=A0A4R2HG38_9ACTN|nr:hypothetical protein EV652_10674 [Kribbella steppae]